jgi:hypothetical protein
MNALNLYTFSNNSAYNRQFIWAAKIYPRSEVFERTCSKCGSREQYPIGAFDVMVEGGTQYPDILGCGAYPFLIVSDKVIDHWHQAGITSFQFYPVGIAEIRSRKLRDMQPPAYFRIEIDGRCRIDLEASGLRINQYCPECHHLSTEPLVAAGFIVVSDSWDGSAIFRDVDLYPRINFCTGLVLDLAHKNKHTNFRFEPMNGPFDSSTKGIEYL